MLKVVNNELFQFETETGTNNYGSYFKTKVNPIMQEKDGKDHRILTIMSSTKDYNENPIMLSSNSKSDNDNANVLAKSFTANKIDMHLYLVAFPFNGLACPILGSNLYRIHRGYLLQSKARDIAFDGGMYKKILYLLIEPNVNFFDQAHRDYRNEINIHFVAHNLENVEGSNDPVTVQETMKVSMKPTGDFAVSLDFVEVPPIDVNDMKGTPLYTVFVRKDRVPADQNYAAKVTNRYQRQDNKPQTRPTYKKPQNKEVEKLGYRIPETDHPRSKQQGGRREGGNKRNYNN
jgi:hypothetical protein